MPNLGGWEFVILIGILVLLFGAKRLPDMARSIGQSARVFKGEMKGLKSDEAPAGKAPPATPPAVLPPAAPVTAAQVTVTPVAAATKPPQRPAEAAPQGQSNNGQ